MRVRLLRSAVLSLRTRWRGGHGRGDGVDSACAVVCSWVQDVVDGAGVAVRADPRGELPALVIFDLWPAQQGSVRRTR